MDIYKLHRGFWDFAFSSPHLIKPNHCAVYAYAIEHCNRLGWKQNFGFPSSVVMEATGIKSYSVYKKTFDELVSWGFFEVIQYSKNQYSSNVIALKDNYKANNKALDKALIRHTSKQVQSTLESTVSIDKQIYQETNIPITEIVNIWTSDFNFLKSDSLWFEQQVEMKYRIPTKDLDHMLSQYWLSLQKANFSGNLNQIRAGLIKWINTWMEKNKTEKPQEQKRNVKVLS